MIIARRNMLSMAALASCYFSLGAQTALPRSVVRLSTSEDPNFDQDFTKQFPLVARSKHFISIRPNIVLLTNSDNVRGIRAFSLLWPDQSKTNQSSSFSRFLPPSSPIVLTAQYNIIGPLSSAMVINRRLFIPASPSSYPEAAKDIDGFLNKLPSESTNGYSTPQTVPMLDSVIFDDWTMTGKDLHSLKDFLECTRNGQHDEAVSVRKYFERNGSNADPSEHLAAHADRSTAIMGDPRLSLYWEARIAEAKRMAAVIETGGVDSLSVRVNRLLNVKPTIIRAA
jgi:hypothetical protein